MEPAGIEADRFALVGHSAGLSFPPSAGRSRALHPLINNWANSTYQSNKLCGHCAVPMATVTIGRAALPDMNRPCLPKLDTRSSQATILVHTRLPLAAHATEPVQAAAWQWPGPRAGIGRADILHTDRAPQRSSLDHPAMPGGHPVLR